MGLAPARVASAVIFRRSPRRMQPGCTWPAFGAPYGPLTAFIALLLRADLTAVALFLGIAFAARLEAARAGVESAVRPDPGPAA